MDESFHLSGLGPLGNDMYRPSKFCNLDTVYRGEILYYFC